MRELDTRSSANETSHEDPRAEVGAKHWANLSAEEWFGAKDRDAPGD